MQRWSTADRPPVEQYSYWREVVCEAFTPLRPVALGAPDRWQRRGLAGRVSSHPFGAVNGAVVNSCAQTIHHGDREIARTEEEVVFVNLMLDGRCRVTQDGRTCSSPAGTFSLVDARRPFRLDFTEPWRTVSFRVPAAALPDVERRTAVHVSTSHGMGQVLSEALTSTWRAAAGLTPEQAAAAGSAVAVLVGALVSSGAGASPPERVPSDVLRDSVDRYVTRQLRGGDVSPAAVASHFGISVRKLHLLYADGPTTFGQRAMHLRVLACADDLAARWGRVTLTELATEWGFSDLSHLNRAFRRHVGCRPLELVDVRRVGGSRPRDIATVTAAVRSSTPSLVKTRRR